MQAKKPVAKKTKSKAVDPKMKPVARTSEEKVDDPVLMVRLTLEEHIKLTKTRGYREAKTGERTNITEFLQMLADDVDKYRLPIERKVPVIQRGLQKEAICLRVTSAQKSKLVGAISRSGCNYGPPDALREILRQNYDKAFPAKRAKVTAKGTVRK